MIFLGAANNDGDSALRSRCLDVFMSRCTASGRSPFAPSLPRPHFQHSAPRRVATCGINYAAIMSCFVAKSWDSFYESVRINYMIPSQLIPTPRHQLEHCPRLSRRSLSVCLCRALGFQRLTLIASASASALPKEGAHVCETRPKGSSRRMGSP